MSDDQNEPYRDPYPDVKVPSADGPNVLLDKYPALRRALDRAKKAARGNTIASGGGTKE